MSIAVPLEEQGRKGEGQHLYFILPTEEGKDTGAGDVCQVVFIFISGAVVPPYL